MRSRHTISISKVLIKIPEETLWIFKSFSLPLGKAKMPLANVIFAENPGFWEGDFLCQRVSLPEPKGKDKPNSVYIQEK